MKPGVLEVPVRIVFDDESRSLLERAASQLDFHATEGGEGAASAEDLAAEIRELLGDD